MPTLPPGYPRPQLSRAHWLSLDGQWEFTAGDGDEPVWRGEIEVPFPPESPRSGIGRRAERCWYRRTFEVPASWRDHRVLLHFGAVDQIATVWVNHQCVAHHEGGYTAFGAELTGVLRDDAEQEIVVRAVDHGDRGTFPVGKQAGEPGGIQYTGASGIWQTVWLEPVPAGYVSDLDLVPDLAGLDVTPEVDGAGERVEAELTEPGGPVVARASGEVGQRLRLDAEAPRRWSPEDPFCYDLTVRLLDERGHVLDEVGSYAGLRTVEVADDGGTPRIAVNGRVTFLLGPLDQGYWPDGGYTAPTDDALRFDLERTKELGFNCVRKHVKIEPARWYYWADRVGLLVWQDMPSLPVLLDNPPGPQSPPVAKARERFETELAAMLRQLRGFPCVIAWVPFNEGWGEFDTARIAAEVKAADPTRLVVADSGVNCCHSHPDTGAGDVYDDHTYVGPGNPVVRDGRAMIDGEYGGLGRVVEGHTWPGEPFAYEMAADEQSLTRRYAEVSEELAALARDGLSAAIYTQLTDVENEVNGLLTYDREVVKVTASVVAEHNRAVIEAGTAPE